MWISLTTTKQKSILVNFTEVIEVVDHANGTQIIYRVAEPTKAGVASPKTIYVQESIDDIEKALKPRKLRL
ncbi:hypothetical protein DQW09_24990 (plasmid) [Ensifer adhaerens]|nr:hypothetical protein DQW09_24990 [Ensifer adhaerens]